MDEKKMISGKDCLRMLNKIKCSYADKLYKD